MNTNVRSITLKRSFLLRFPFRNHCCGTHPPRRYHCSLFWYASSTYLLDVSFTLFLRYRWPREYNNFAARIRNLPSHPPTTLRFFLPPHSTKRCPIVWPTRMWQIYASQIPCQGIWREFHQYHRVNSYEQVVW